MTYFPYAKKSFYSIRSTKFKFGPNKLKIKIMDRTHLSMEIKQKIIALRNYSSKTFSEIAAECECSVSNFLGRNFIWGVVVQTQHNFPNLLWVFHIGNSCQTLVEKAWRQWKPSWASSRWSTSYFEHWARKWYYWTHYWKSIFDCSWFRSWIQREWGHNFVTFSSQWTILLYCCAWNSSHGWPSNQSYCILSDHSWTMGWR